MAIPQLVGLAAVGAAAYLGYRVIKREMGRIGAELDRTRTKDGRDSAQKLIQDPETGVYRPENRS